MTNLNIPGHAETYYDLATGMSIRQTYFRRLYDVALIRK